MYGGVPSSVIVAVLVAGEAASIATILIMLEATGTSLVQTRGFAHPPVRVARQQTDLA
jgi:uncharacterized membrane protein YraQ (UPF0718 family)